MTWLAASVSRPGCHVMLNSPGGSQLVTWPHSADCPSGDRSTSAPSSNATVAPAPNTLSSASGHQSPILLVNSANATSGGASTRISR